MLAVCCPRSGSQPDFGSAAPVNATRTTTTARQPAVTVAHGCVSCNARELGPAVERMQSIMHLPKGFHSARVDRREDAGCVAGGRDADEHPRQIPDRARFAGQPRFDPRHLPPTWCVGTGRGVPIALTESVRGSIFNLQQAELPQLEITIRSFPAQSAGNAMNSRGQPRSFVRRSCRPDRVRIADSTEISFVWRGRVARGLLVPWARMWLLSCSSGWFVLVSLVPAG